MYRLRDLSCTVRPRSCMNLRESSDEPCENPDVREADDCGRCAGAGECGMCVGWGVGL